MACAIPKLYAPCFPAVAAVRWLPASLAERVEANHPGHVAFGAMQVQRHSCCHGIDVVILSCANPRIDVLAALIRMFTIGKEPAPARPAPEAELARLELQCAFRELFLHELLIARPHAEQRVGYAFSLLLGDVWNETELGHVIREPQRLESELRRGRRPEQGKVGLGDVHVGHLA